MALLVLSNLAISESKFDQLEKEVEILKQELLQARQAGRVFVVFLQLFYHNVLICIMLHYTVCAMVCHIELHIYTVQRTESQTNLLQQQQQQQQRDMAANQNKTTGGKHDFVVRSFDAPTKCDHCSSVMIGLVRQGMICKSE